MGWLMGGLAMAVVALIGVVGALLLGGDEEPAVEPAPVAAPEPAVEEEPQPEQLPIYSAQELGEHFGDAVWRVDVDGCGMTASGTAFAVAPRLLVTNAHVVEIDPNPRLTSRDGVSVNGEVIGLRDWPDVAVIRVDEPMATTLRWAPTDELVEGQPVTALSYPTPLLSFSVAPGTLLSFQVQAGERIALASDEITDYGSSGAPLLDTHGQVAGVVTEFADGDGRQLVGLSYTYSLLEDHLDEIVGNPSTVTADCSGVGAPALPEEWSGLDWATSEADDYGDDPGLDRFWDACEAGDLGACDDLFRYSPIDSIYEAYGDSCGDRQPTGTGTWCVDLPPGEQVPGTGSGYGTDSFLDSLWDACADGEWISCDQLYTDSPLGSEYERFGDTCGDRNAPAGWCTDIYGGS